MNNLEGKSDRTALAVFRQSYPIDFRLSDDNDQQVLYINDDPVGQNLNLEIDNTAEQAIALIPPSNGSTANANNYHFALKFRSGTLSSASLGKIAIAESGWSHSYEQQTNSLYILRTTPQTLDPTDKILLTLQHIKADGGGGSRGTRVELKYQQLNYVVDNTPLSGNRIKHLDIINQRGRKNIPLHVGFVGSNTILNDGKSANELTLRLTNVLKNDSIALLPKDNTGSKIYSKFIISFEIDEDWALGTKSQVATIEIEGKDWETGDEDKPETDWDVKKELQGGSPEWTVTHQNQVNPELAPGQVLEISITNIISSLPSGNTNLYLRYENIPGYWDGQFIVPIEKAPIIYCNVLNDDYSYSGKSNVGIGTTNPSALLTLDPQGAGGIAIGNPNTSKQGYTAFNLNISEANNGYSSLQSIKSSKGSIPFWQICFFRLVVKSGSYSLMRYVSSIVGCSRTTWGTLALNPSGGNVGIGTTNPGRPLAIRATDTGQELISFEDPSGTTKWHLNQNLGGDKPGLNFVETDVADGRLFLQAGGNVGIGTVNPQAKLEVSGSIKSPMWGAISVFRNYKGPLPITSQQFETGGGTLMIFASGTAGREKGGLIGIDIVIDGQIYGNATIYTKEGVSHKLFSNTFIASGVPAGSHSVTIQQFSDASEETLTDENDLFNLTILELPF